MHAAAGPRAAHWGATTPERAALPVSLRLRPAHQTSLDRLRPPVAAPSPPPRTTAPGNVVRTRPQPYDPCSRPTARHAGQPCRPGPRCADAPNARQSWHLEGRRLVKLTWKFRYLSMMAERRPRGDGPRTSAATGVIREHPPTGKVIPDHQHDLTAFTKEFNDRRRCRWGLLHLATDLRVATVRRDRCHEALTPPGALSHELII